MSESDIDTLDSNRMAGERVATLPPAPSGFAPAPGRPPEPAHPSG